MIDSLVDDILDFTAERAANPSAIWGYPWGFAELDELTGGIHHGEMTTVAARTSEGKSVILIQAIMNIARHLVNKELPGRVMLYSPEMQARAIWMRYLQMRTAIPSELVKQGMLNPEQRMTWEQAAKSTLPYNGRVLIEAGNDLHISDVIAEVESQMMLEPENPIVAVGVDYVQYLKGDGSGKYEQVTDVAQKLKAMANRLNVAVIAAAQLAKPPKKDWKSRDKEEEPPTKEDISDSQYIARVSDNVIVLWRPDSKWGGRKARVALEKQRDGSTGTFHLAYDPQTTRFTDW